MSGLAGVAPPRCPSLDCRDTTGLTTGSRTVARTRKGSKMEATIECVMVEHVRCLDPVLEEGWRKWVREETPAHAPPDELTKKFAAGEHTGRALPK